MNYNNLVKKHDLKVNKVTIKNYVAIIDTPLGQFVFKKNNDIKKYEYLLSRGFDYIPKIIDYDEDVIMFEYINNINYDIDEKIYDYIKLIGLLHRKTSYYKEINNTDNKYIYEEIISKLNGLNNYYDSLINIIETKEYMSPCEYLICRNFSIIKSAINYSYSAIENWYKEVKDYNKKRVVTLYNNPNLNDMLKDINKTYFINFDYSKVDIPIIDLLIIYNVYYEKFDFYSIFSLYNKTYPLNNDEKILLNCLISIPPKIEINNNVNSISNIKHKINKIYCTLDFLNSEEKEKTSTHKDENNKE